MERRSDEYLMSYYDLPAIPGWTYTDSAKVLFFVADHYKLEAGGTASVILTNQLHPDRYYRWLLTFADTEEHIADSEAERFFRSVESLGYQKMEIGFSNNHNYIEKIMEAT